MTTRQKIKINCLRVLLAADGTPMPDDALVAAVQLMTFPHPSVAEVRVAGQELEVAGLLAGATDKIGVLSWTLTVSGQHQANQL